MRGEMRCGLEFDPNLRCARDGEYICCFFIIFFKAVPTTHRKE